MRPSWSVVLLAAQRLLCLCDIIPAAAGPNERTWCCSRRQRRRQRRSAFALIGYRGGAQIDTENDDDNNDDNQGTPTPTNNPLSVVVADEDGYTMLAKAIRSLHLESNKNIILETTHPSNRRAPAPAPNVPTVAQLVAAFRSLSAAQKAFKGIDGAAYEAYQRTQSVDDVDFTVVGRAKRSLARTNAVANGLLACELCEALVVQPVTPPPLSPPSHDTLDDTLDDSAKNITDGSNSTSTSTSNTTDSTHQTSTSSTVWTGRQVRLNVTTTIPLGNSYVHVLVLYEPGYNGGVGENHGGLLDETDTPAALAEAAAATNNSNETTTPNRGGRFLVVIGDGLCNDLNETIRHLNQPPRRLRLHGTGDNTDTGSSSDSNDDVVWVQPTLYQVAVAVLDVLEPILLQSQDDGHPSTPAVHFTGRSLSGGIAALAAAMLNGDLPMSTRTDMTTGSTSRQAARAIGRRGVAPKKSTVPILNGWGRGRTSAVSLGAPPCLSGHVEVPYVTCILYGDDVVSRLSPHSIEQFLRRTRRALQQQSGEKGDNMILSKQLNWMANTISLTTSTLKSQVLTSAREKANRLTWAGGHVYLVRPRRLGGGGSCSIHELGGRNLREAILWQLNDVLLSRSLWKHHQLESYIHGLDRVHLRGFDEASP